MGLVNISGFHVDPGYSGKLIFAVFNAGPARIHLQKGQRIFPLWMASLDERIARQASKQGYDGIPPSLVTQISSDFTTAYQIKTDLDKVREDIAALKVFKLYASLVVSVCIVVFTTIIFPILKDRVTQIFSQSTLDAPHSLVTPTVQPQPSLDKK